MGKWAKSIFGQETFGPIGIVLAGTSSEEFEKEVTSLFDEVIWKKDAVYHCYIAKKNGVAYPIVFNVYGAAAAVDIITNLHDGGCRNLIFVGYAYGGFKNLAVGSVMLPDKAYHFDGIYSEVDPERRISEPDETLMLKLIETLDKNKIKYIGGDNISVPAVTFQPPHANEHYKKIDPSTCEMELAAFLARSRDIGIRTAATLIISDNKSSAISDESKKELRRKAKKTVISTIIQNIKAFELPELQIKKPFNVNEYLASIIATDEESPNIYKQQ